jgi:D-lactate dehydrogenase
LGFDLHGKTVGVIGTGNIGTAFAKIVLGFGCKAVADVARNEELVKAGVNYTDLEALLKSRM